MLKFQTHPDRVFTDILQESMSLMVDQLRIMEEKLLNNGKHRDIQILLPNAETVFNVGTALNTLRRMLHCHWENVVFCMNSYHFLILYDVLQHYCDIRNDMLLTADGVREKEELSMIAGVRIEKIDFDGLVALYFFDIDFLLDSETVSDLGLDKRAMLGIQNETFGISQGMSPHPEELELSADEHDRHDPAEQPLLWSESSTVYPDMYTSGY
jgi:hypothetical protein